MRTVLFLCTGNYYRSRFAEILFNALATRRGLAWRASSRGTDVVGLGRFNVGPISDAARRALEDRGIRVGARPRRPRQLAAEDLAAADLIVAVCEAEHRPHLERDHPTVAARVEFWGVDDLAVIPADEALPAIERHVERLIDRLSTTP